MKIESLYKYTVKYSDTDQMGFLHHSKYACLYENARWELFRNLGLSYKEIEEAGIIIPVIQMSAKFIKSIKYDDEIVILTEIVKPPTSKLEISYNLFNERKELVHQSEVILGFISKKTKKACRPPVELKCLLNKYLLT